MDCYIRFPVCSALYARNAQYVCGPSSLRDPFQTMADKALQVIPVYSLSWMFFNLVRHMYNFPFKYS